MASRCQFGAHGPCNGCERIVIPTQSDHVHIHRGHGRASEILCDDCWLKVAIASIPILQALKTVGFDSIDPVSLRSYVRDHVTVGVDVPFLWEGAASGAS